MIVAPNGITDAAKRIARHARSRREAVRAGWGIGEFEDAAHEYDMAQDALRHAIDRTVPDDGHLTTRDRDRMIDSFADAAVRRVHEREIARRFTNEEDWTMSGKLELQAGQRPRIGADPRNAGRFSETRAGALEAQVNALFPTIQAYAIHAEPRPGPRAYVVELYMREAHTFIGFLGRDYETNGG